MKKSYIISILLNIIIVFICGVVALGIMVNWFSGGGTDSGLDINRIFLLAILFSPALISTYITYRLALTQKTSSGTLISNISETNITKSNENKQIFNLEVDDLYTYHIGGLTLLAWVISTVYLFYIFGDNGFALVLILYFFYPVALVIQALLAYFVFYFKKNEMFTELKIASILSMTFLPLAIVIVYFVDLIYEI